jgi:hypothetical protein
LSNNPGNNKAILNATNYIIWISWFGNFTEWLNQHMLTCPSKKYLHLECPGCGLQRSAIALLNGHFTESLRLYPATIPLVLLFIFLAFHLRLKFPKGAIILKYSQMGTAIVILVFYIYKIVNHQIIV